MTYSQGDMDAILGKRRARARIRCRAIRPIAGGQPAGDKGLRSFVEHHLGLEPGSKDFEDAVKRISEEEIGEVDVTAEGGEVETKEVYQVNCIRKSKIGPFLLEHQVKAMLKQAASRMGIFKKKIGSKGDLAEMGTVRAAGASLMDPKRPWEIYLLAGSKKPAATHWEKISGSVNTPKGKKSIMHHTEVTQEGAEFEFEVDWMPTKLKKADFLALVAAATQIGIGSCQSLGYGKWEVVEMDVKMPKGESEEAAD